MGYSISVRLPTPELRDHALAFLRQDLQAHPHACNIQPVKGEDLSYPPSGNLERVLGFNGSIMGPFAWFACAWLAHKAGTNKNGTWHLYYDHEYIPIREVEGATHLAALNDFVLVNAQGIKDTSRHGRLDRWINRREYKRLRKMIARWNEAWPAGLENISPTAKNQP